VELRRYVAPLFKWWWLILVATLIALGSAEWATRDLPLVYRAHTTLIIGRVIFDPNPNSYDFGLNNQLAQSYADIASREPVQNATMKALGLRGLPKYEARPNSQLLEISVTDTSPERAQAVASELARQLILLSPGNGPSSDLEHQAFVNQQLQEMEESIKDTKAEVAVLQGELGQIVSASELSDVQAQIRALEGRLTTLQSIYANLLAASQEGATNTISILEPAALPVTPIGPNRLLIILLATASGLVLAAGAAYLLEYLNDTFEKPEDIRTALNVPIIGYIGEMGKRNGKRPYVLDQPFSDAAEAFRALRTNIEIVETDKPLQIISICSAGPSEGKTSTAVNLAIVTARTGKKVILVDADMRRPAVHRYLGIPNREGWVEIFEGFLNTESAIQTWEEDNLGIITAGHFQQDAADSLSSKKIGNVLSHLRTLADVIIVDGPPFFTADAMMLASKVDGVLLVVRPGYSRKPTVLAMMEQLNRGGARILGVTANRVSGRQAGYYYSRHALHHVDKRKNGHKEEIEHNTPTNGQRKA